MGKKLRGLSTTQMLRIFLAMMLLFVTALSSVTFLFAYRFSERQFAKSFQAFSQNIETQLDAQFEGIEKSIRQFTYFSNMQEILFSKDPIVYLQNISGCNQLLDYLRQSSPLIAEIMIDSPFGHSFFSGSTGKYQYKQLVETIREESPGFSGPFFRTLPDDSSPLPQLIYCFRVNNTQRRGFLLEEYAIGVARVNVNQLINLKGAGDYENEIKALLYQDDVVYTSRDASPEELAMLQEYDQHELLSGSVEYIRHAVPLKDMNLTMIDLVPKNSLLRDIHATRNILLLAMLVVCLLLAVFTELIVHEISNPIKQLVTDMQRIQQGKKRRMALPGLKDLRYVAYTVNETLEVLEAASLRQQEMSLRLYQTTLAQKQAQLNAYRNQINPHFLFNTLESMRSMARHYKAPMLEAMLTSLAALFRYSLRSEIIVSLEKELAHTRHYFTVMDMRAPQRYELRVHVSDEARTQNILSMILQPLIENSIQHGFIQKKGPCIILIQGRKNPDGSLSLAVTDNGRGMSQNDLLQLRHALTEKGNAAQNEHIGLDNVVQRLRLFYGEGFRFSIRSMQGHFMTVQFQIPHSPPGLHPTPGNFPA
ncbi:sensor histidine kinase [Acutalibacter sp. 1XD8-33]|uniref:sensor histidine kinase n=1 Tax=Acutalibacter sp. 1XD8-33 TaxID=2320081 RepID=UPI00131451CA|nr:histidine kinase [Acutalibacter sp. 1XD8-33]